MAFTFNHDSESVSSAIGVELTDLENLTQKSKNIITDRKNHKVTKASHFIEKSCKEFSYTELVILAGFYLLEKYRENKLAEEAKSNPEEALNKAVENLMSKMGLKGGVLEIKKASGLESFLRDISGKKSSSLSLEDLLKMLKDMNNGKDSA
jgi:hypothetical protein